MYVVVPQLIINYLAQEECRFYITFDGWCNNSMTGFYPVTIHWVSSESGRQMSMLINFMHVFPGDGVGKRCGEAIFKHLKAFDIGTRLLYTTSDGASDAILASNELGRLLHDAFTVNILPSSHMIRCMVHTFQLGIKAALDVITPKT